ncbi:hypothetical protein [Sphingomonas sp. LT1P40]|uniref:hypothetical protein n=1 Tax=Alteristakelama amylovorans TaxID=3096166 RepID=UPI002FC67254
MATIADTGSDTRRDDGFFLWGGLTMAAVITAGFVFFVLMGISSFNAPPVVHAHALVFFGWVVIYVAQTLLATRGSIALHRRLGWIGAGWLVVMAVVGPLVAIEAIRLGRAAPIYEPAFFLIYAPLGVWVFVGLSTAAILLRRQSDWHKRLHFSGMAILTGPGIGRLVPAPLVMPHAATIELCLLLLFPLAGMLWDLRTRGRIHAAWFWGVGAILTMRLVSQWIANSAFGLTLFELITTGQPGGALAPYEFPPFGG